MDSLLEEEELKWQQRVKQQQLTHVDRNTKFYHMYANQRKNTNFIKQIIDNEGTLHLDQASIGDIFNSYFNNLFHSSNPAEIDNCLFYMQARDTLAMPSMLLSEFSDLEVQEAIFQMAPLSSLGSDGFPTQFCQTHWEEVGNDVCNFALNFFLERDVLLEVLITLLVL